MRNSSWWRLTLIGLLFPLFLSAACAQSYPSRTIQLIAPMAPGGGIDNLGRYISRKLSERLGQSVVVENRPGANGNIGASLVRRAAPDGYTLLMTYVGTQAINASLYKNLGFDPVEDFEAVAPLAATPYVIVTHPSVPAKTLKELVAYARANPGRLNYGSAGAGSVGHLAGKMFEQKTGTEMNYVSYKGTAPALMDLLGGQIQLMFNTLSSVGAQFRNGGIRPIALASKTRSAAYPDIPTSAEAGYKDYLVGTWYGIVAPKGTPKAVIDRLNREINLILEEEEVKKWYAREDYEAMHMSAGEFAKFIREERDSWKKIIVDGKVTVE